ncbi:MAG: hypothetical protein HRU75_05545 [Planctomycetia bacterium]|nr:MAG: hypothetical protein HRU75_05545 [Planctomycetia bacterium]
MFRILALILAITLQPFLGWSYTGCRSAAPAMNAAMTCCSTASPDGCSGGCGGCGSTRTSTTNSERSAGCCDPSDPIGFAAVKPCCNPSTCILTQTGPTLTRAEPSKLTLPKLSQTPLPTPLWIAPTPQMFIAVSRAWMQPRAGPWDGSQQTRRALLCIRTI